MHGFWCGNVFLQEGSDTGYSKTTRPPQKDALTSSAESLIENTEFLFYSKPIQNQEEKKSRTKKKHITVCGRNIVLFHYIFQFTYFSYFINKLVQKQACLVRIENSAF